MVVSPWAVVPIVAFALQGGPHLSKLELVIGGVFLGIFLAVPIAYLALAIVGYPTAKLLLRLGCLNALALCGSGCFWGAIGGAVAVGTEAIFLCALCGLAVSLAAWLVIRKDALALKGSAGG